MNLLLQRTTKTPQSTEGQLFVDNDFQCYTREPVHREQLNVPVSAWKVFGSTAIPVGTEPFVLELYQKRAPAQRGGITRHYSRVSDENAFRNSAD